MTDVTELAGTHTHAYMHVCAYTEREGQELLKDVGFSPQ